MNRNGQIGTDESAQARRERAEADKARFDAKKARHAADREQAALYREWTMVGKEVLGFVAAALAVLVTVKKLAKA